MSEWRLPNGVRGTRGGSNPPGARSGAQRQNMDRSARMEPEAMSDEVLRRSRLVPGVLPRIACTWAAKGGRGSWARGWLDRVSRWCLRRMLEDTRLALEAPAGVTA